MAADIAVISSPPCAAPPPANTDPARLFSSDVLLGRKMTAAAAAADSGHLLIHMAVSVRDPWQQRRPDDDTTYYEHNLFVYKAAASPSPPSLQLLPDSHEYWTDQGRHYGIIAGRRRDDDDDGDPEFVAAAFRAAMVCTATDEEIEHEQHASWEEVGELSLFSSSTGQWEVIELQMPFDAERGLYPLTWETDKAFSLGGGGSSMCFVDYHRGILYCDDVLADDCRDLIFVPLPGIEIQDDSHCYSHNRQLPAGYRTVDVSQGQVKFVDIDHGQTTSDFTVTVWSLKMPEMKRWEKDYVLRANDLWSRPKFCGSRLPRRALEFPVVSRHDSDVVHFMVQDPELNEKAYWMISVNMKEMELQSCVLHTNVAKEEGYFSSRSLGTPMICCDLNM